MLKFAAGLVLGAAAAAFAKDELEQGYLFGWTVTKNDQMVCADPFVYASPKEIACQ